MRAPSRARKGTTMRRTKVTSRNRPAARAVLILILAAFAFAAGCGGETKFDVKLNNVELRNLRNASLGLDLKFDRTVRSISREDAVTLAAKVYPADGGAPVEILEKGIDGMRLADTLVVAGAGTHDPAAFYKVEARLERDGKAFASGLFLVEKGIGRKTDRKGFDAAPLPPPPPPPEGETGADAPAGE